jgi:hypothetical protein
LRSLDLITDVTAAMAGTINAATNATATYDARTFIDPPGADPVSRVLNPGTVIPPFTLNAILPHPRALQRSHLGGQRGDYRDSLMQQLPALRPIDERERVQGAGKVQPLLGIIVISRKARTLGSIMR